MKKGAIERNFRKIKNEYHQIDEIVKHAKNNALWEHEANVRKKLKELREFDDANLPDYYSVYEKYHTLLQNISIRMIEDYNYKNNTHFTFEEITGGNQSGYLKSGVMSILITQHIPKLVTKQFETLFPANPKNEYESARKIKRKFFLHLGETNTGKTYNAMQRLKSAENGVYLSPLRILALENYERLNNEGIRCSLITGEEEIIIDSAIHTSCTIEKLNLYKEYEVAVIDEVQMIADDQRGTAWTRAVLGLQCTEIHVCGALNAKELLIQMIEDCEDIYELKEYSRDIPLEIVNTPFVFERVDEGDALVAFSKKRVLELAYFYADLGLKSSIIYGDLPPEVRRKQYEQFIDKENIILITTDAIGMGVNLPIKRIIFMDTKKFDGDRIRYLTSQEVKQIAGRAGRKGIYDIGYVASCGNTQQFIHEMITTKDPTIEKGVIGPSEAILQITSLPLKEKLALWSTREEKIPYYKKMAIDQYLVILDQIKPYKLSELNQWKLLKIPFDVANPAMMEVFLYNVNELFVNKREELPRPALPVKELYELELYYQKINLYYSFCKLFELQFDNKWVYQERTRVSDEINELLVDIINRA